MRRETVHTFAMQSNLAPVRNQRTADEIEQRRLARSVRSHDAENVSRLNRQADIPDGGNAAECLGDFIESEKRHEMFDFKALHAEFTAEAQSTQRFLVSNFALRASAVN